MSGATRRLLLTAAAAAAATLPAAPAAPAASPALSHLQATERSIASRRRAAVLDLYSLDLRLAARGNAVATLERHAAAVRAGRVRLTRELQLARADIRTSQRRLAARLRMLFEGGSPSPLEVFLGASSLSDAFARLDELARVSAVDREVIVQVRGAQARERGVHARLAAEGRRLAEAVAGAQVQLQRLAGVRAARTAFVSELAAREAAGASAIARIEAEARAAAAKTVRVTRRPPAATVAETPPRATAGSLIVATTGYCLRGRTATGIPVGWGVAAVDPRVIPLGTHLVVPGYGDVVAADTGGAIVGDRIDLWFPSCAQAGGWGTRSVTIALR